MGFAEDFLQDPEAKYNECITLLSNQIINNNRDWNREYRAKLQELGLCLRYKKTRPYHIQAVTPAMGHSHAWPKGMFIVEMSPLHPLHQEEWYEQQGEQGIQADPERYTGRTTAIALRIIHDAISNPEQLIDIIDHTPYRQSDKYLAKIIQWMIESLELRHLHIDISKREEITLVFQRRDEPTP